MRRAYRLPSEAEQRATMGVPKVRILARGPLASHDIKLFSQKADAETLDFKMFFLPTAEQEQHAVR